MTKISDHHKNKIKSSVSNRRKTRPFKPPVFPDMIAMEYGKAITREVKKIDDLVKEILIPKLDKITNTKNERLDSDVRLDIDLKELAGVALVAELIRRMKSRFYGETLEEDQEPSQRLFSKSSKRLSEPFLKRANEFSEKNFVREFENQTGTKPLGKHLDVGLFMDESLARNVNLIKTLPAEYFSGISNLIYRAVDEGQLTKEVKAELSKFSKDAKNRASLIARDQISKLVSSTNEVRQKKLGVTHYIWRTMKDSRVRSLANTSGRSDHKHLEGTLQKWSEKPVTVFSGKRAGARNHPGEDFQCRCFAQAVYDEITGIRHPETEKARRKTESIK